MDMAECPKCNIVYNNIDGTIKFCARCGRELFNPRKDICQSCNSRIVFVGDQYCRRCGVRLQ